MARSIWKGVISFGMVSIPVKLYTATDSKDISFHFLHDECKGRIKQVRWCPVHDRALSSDELVRGYEYAKDRHVVLTDEDFENLPLPSKHTIELSAFVKAEEIDPVYYEKAYYLEPDEPGLKPYALLMKALGTKGLTAIAKIALRNRESLCAIRPMDGTLMLETLFYPDEVRIESQPKVPDVLVSERELAMAYSLIELLSEEEFQPEKYRDEYRDALMQIIEAKLQGEEIVAAPEPAATPVVDLMEALKASVEAARKAKAEPAPEAASRNKARAG